MEKINNLTEEQILFYEKLSGNKIDIKVKPDPSHIGCYMIVNKDGSRRWRTIADILQYIKAKTVKEINNNLNAMNNNFNANNFMFERKDLAIQKSICLTRKQIDKVKKNAKYFKISFSNVIGQLIDKNL